MNKEDYLLIASSIPHEPGVYRFIDPEDEILYIGKAKDLRKRVSSYFNENNDPRRKTRIMVRASVRIEWTIVDSEQDALLLEASLIRKHRPRYNIALKDSRPYPYLCISNEPFPRLLFTRELRRDGSRYFGPYTSKHRVYGLLDLIRQLFKLRNCALHLSQDNIQKGKFKVCLEYHIKNCLGPCVGFESPEAYQVKIEQVANILKGNFASVRRYLKEAMQTCADNLEFERAQEIKEQLRLFEDYQGKSIVANPALADVDVFALHQDEGDNRSYVTYLKVVQGSLLHTYTLELQPNLDDSPEDILGYAVQELRDKFQSLAPEIILPMNLSLPWPEVKQTVPQIGDKKKLLELAEKNLRYFVLQKQKQAATRAAKKTPAERILEQMQKDLQTEGLPLHLECFDNSNLQGTNPVSAMVVFRNAKPAKRDYRHYHIKTVEGPDDFASMREVVHRRYSRLLAEKIPLPQLIIVDGGKGQLSAAAEVLRELGILDRVKLIGIAKRLEEIYFVDDPTPLLLSKKSPTLQIIQQARDEAHRFGLSFHRDLRSKSLLQTELTRVPGLGQKTADKLLSQLGSVEAVKQADEASLAAVVGKAMAAKIKAYYAGELEL